MQAVSRIFSMSSWTGTYSAIGSDMDGKWGPERPLGIRSVARWSSFAAVAALIGPTVSAAPALPPPVVAVLEHEGLPASSLSVLVQALDEDRPRVSHLVDVPRNPASAMKIVTTWAALNLLGPGYTWTTQVRADRQPVKGRIQGNLYLKGSGDPFLVTERFWRLLSTVRRKGVNEIAGDFVVDRSVFDLDEPARGEFDGKPQRAYNVEPDGALLNFGATEIHIERRAGRKRPLVQIDPPLLGLRIENALAFVDRPCRGRLNIQLFTEAGVSPGLRVTGKFPRRCRRTLLLRAVVSHEAYARGLVGHLWREVGGTLHGSVRNGRMPEGAEVIAEHESEPFALLGWRLNKFSNNVMARQVFLSMGREAEEAPGTIDKGRKAVKRWLASQGLDHPSLFIDNGSGLSRTVRVRADTLGKLLAHAYRSPLRAEFVATFPLAAVDGTLAKRFRDSPVAGRAHLKTGLLSGVRALAGYVHGMGGKRYLVVSLQNHPGVQRGAGTRVQNALLAWISTLSG